MKKRMYWKTMWQSLLSSKGRFFSIFNLMLIGSMTFIGLKVAAPNMEKTAQDYIEQGQMLDIAVMSDLGISQADKVELDRVTGAQIEYAYFKDVTFETGKEAIRLFSIPKNISRYQLKAGKAPSSAREILLSTNLDGAYQIGDKITIKEGDKQASILKETVFIVTGFADSSEIWGKINLGPASTGTGQLAAYAFVPEAAFDSEVYTMARIRYDDVSKVPYYQAVYKQKVISHQDELNKLLADNGKERLANIRKDGKDKIDDAERKMTAAQDQLETAEKQLATKEASLEAAEQQLNQGQADLELKANRLDQIAADLAAAQKQLNSSYSQLQATKKELDTKRTDLDKRKRELEQIEAGLLSTQSDLKGKEQDLEKLADRINQAKSDFEATTQAIQDQIAVAVAMGENPGDIPELVEFQLRLKQLETDIATMQQAYQTGQVAYETAVVHYQQQEATYRSAKEQYEYGEAQYQVALSSYQEGVTAYQIGLSEYESGRLAFENGQNQLELARTSLADKQAESDRGKAELQKAKKDFERKRAKAEEEIKTTRKDLQVAQANLAQLNTPEYKSYTRDSLPGGNGYANYVSSTKSISAVGNIFPIVLYVIAALVTFMTMTRFVDEERVNVGILKALGYTNGQILIKFVLYGLLSGLSGTIMGLLLGNFLLAPMISRIITDTTVIGESQLSVYPKWIMLALIFSLLSSVLPAYLVAQKELRERPAQLLQAKPPVLGAKIFLECFPFIWRRMSFTQKVTARNIFRYKKRMFMTIIGIAGSVALLFAGLGIRSSISGVMHQQFTQLLHYHMVVVEQERASKEEKAKVETVLRSKDIRDTLSIAYYSLNETIKGQDEALTVNFFVSKEKDLSSFITLRNPETGQSLVLPEKGAIVSEKFAQLNQVEVGDRITIHLNQEPISLKVAGITEMYAGHFIYLSAPAYQEVTGKSYQPNATLVMLADDRTKMVEKVSADLLDMKGVVAVVQNTSLITLLETIVQSLQSVMMILIVLSVLLGIVILYNLTNINMAERVREVSTIKVLGFYDREVTFYIYRETMTLSLVGIGLGLFVGFFLHRLLLVVIASPAIHFAPTVSVDVYLIPIGAVLSILAILGIYVHHHLSKLNMLEALKSGE
ncbi:MULTISPECIES: ABC transporter permease [unclassified Streptococcus]|uniref:ABC transporter permease n=1 Tax=unclassified Streptococcus TaxID=2608887 RepID=UPI0010715D3B|nr:MULTISPECIES: ABC transporter permease [unclassified Streptococcus]MBF0787899.1 FtsX-like permease family protein [Streptococcus sp. 19428wC2_LYSM12]MCQ9212166.1 FtsX-like permease family protein [Streptococcus sp. B01]MCQ9213496.1 FtsX-like permease family protein [Streptococcus sp. O1]TFV05082.1 ABC transporter permease [Streptococcus sp. LYSM12]